MKTDCKGHTFHTFSGAHFAIVKIDEVHTKAQKENELKSQGDLTKYMRKTSSRVYKAGKESSSRRQWKRKTAMGSMNTI